MTDPQDNNFGEIAEPKPAQTESGPGQSLRAGRLERGLSIEDIARQLRLSVRQVTALEEDDYSKVASGTFLRGFVRNYAKLLQMDAAPLLQRLEQSLPPPPPTQTISYPIEGIPFPSNRDHGKRNLIIGVAIVLALLLLVYEIYRGSEANIEKAPGGNVESRVETEQTSDASLFEAPPEITADGADIAASAGRPAASEPKPDVQPPPVRSASSPVVPAAPQAAQQPAQQPAASRSADAPSRELADEGPGVVRLIFEGESWVEARDGKGRLLLSRVNARGTEQVLRGTPPFSLKIGNAAEVKLVYNSNPVDLTPHINVYGGTARLSLE
ncbi:cytoskeleton protein RodZ [Nitrosospira sp. Nsp2]|uniref:RodZ domain-containing protein n=1 Tax=Nitrosospira sp. Nsp2 TaxID=136548 RepID=UPI000D4D41F9|nr:RodZ domain-containing protein [Nitrosospira sp. Nsp2]PTR13941.1 cytoskeleton protein RodZ [Nitrosospira sp. Nsp2]